MFEGLQENQLKGALEAMMFVSDEPIGIITFADMLEVEPAQVEAALVELQDDLERENRGIQLREVAGGWRLYTHPAYHELIEKYVISWDTRKLSQAAMETLAIVAYQQPITRAGVASVRGVNSDSSINSLVEKGLLREAGTADSPGNPVLYATTRSFLERFGLRTLDDLPDLEQFAPDEETRELIRERLSASREDVLAAEGVEGGEGEEGDPFEGVSFDFDDEALPREEGAGAAADKRIAGVDKDAAGGREAGAGKGAGASGDGAVETRAAAAASGKRAADAASAGAADGAVPSQAAQDALADAMAGSLGLVDKIDFDKLTFETDDE